MNGVFVRSVPKGYKQDKLVERAPQGEEKSNFPTKEGKK
jgi:hypothetical protein